MGSSVSSDNKSNGSSPSRTPPTMQKSVTHQVIPSCGPPSFQSALNPPRPLKGILKNKNPPIAEKPVEIAKPVKIVELYVLRGSEWSVTRVREDEVEGRKRELKSDKTVKRVYSKPTHDTTFLHFQPF